PEYIGNFWRAPGTGLRKGCGRNVPQASGLAKPVCKPIAQRKRQISEDRQLARVPGPGSRVPNPEPIKTLQPTRLMSIPISAIRRILRTGGGNPLFETVA